MTSQARLVGGRYEEGEPLGRGGMAEVRKGLDNRLGRSVAIKRLRVDLASDATFQARFRREAQSAASLNHPTIVSVYDTGEEPDPNGSGVTIPYIVMELVTGKTLRDLIREGRKIMPERALEITSGVLEALDYSHRAGIVHRDIKPGNVMLTPQGQVKVMDFGIARAVADTSSTMTQTAAVIGTAQYLSPEQARGETVDARSDLYSTGCLLYELLTGRPPFVGESPVSVAYQHVREQPLPPSSFDPDIPPEVDAVVLKALAKSREERYQSASEMRADIHRVLAGQQVTAPMAAVAETRSMAPTAVAAAATQQYQQTSANDLLPPGGDDLDEAQDARSRRNRGLAYFLLGLAIVAVAVGAYALFSNMNKDNNAGGGGTTATPVAKVAVPDVSGKSVADATALLADKGLKFAQGPSETSDTVGRGSAIRQTPPAGTEAEQGSTVTVVFSSGRSAFPVPDVIGKSESAARKALEGTSANFKVKDKTIEQDSDQKKGIVLAVSPDPTGKYPSGQEFTLTVSTGKTDVDVPNVVTQTFDDAKLTLEQAGFRVGQTFGNDQNQAEGTVLKQSVKAGSKAAKGTLITLTVNKLQEETPPPSTPTESETPPPSTPTSPAITIPGG
ncbi:MULTISPECIES: Stk1 family PASTA domain-containing Ser/Thr kinase [Kribbella]|jgi:serine/threonine-protein kinase|uniref:non-specific serine/threonine protein kinase n=1 Tax=Kribbella pratensis TaxID=2512112 RepID=A0ABY2FEW9_9ACTN|nr:MULTISPECIES: Stk1 family PASTA domain-containing Ser/Thr kinase [Kribbella]TDW89742.1 serine/threonine-protein kinase [Kribbella pratensis]TDX08805.1 serine/threonine-protein kinase [Kribbella sp. VKM Ac-2566]